MSDNATLVILAAAAVVGGAVLFLRRQENPGEGSGFDLFAGIDSAWMPEGEDTMPDQLPNLLESTIVQASEAASTITQAVGLNLPPDAGTAGRNERAFLDMIAYAEGTGGPHGYRTLFGGGLFDDLSDHPRQSFAFTDRAGRNLRTTAAGRYQFLIRTWDALARKLDLPDFGPASQDRAALELVRERGALQDVRAGRIQTAIAKCAPIWASLPGAGYAQPERKLSNLLATYAQAGGTTESAA
jgi:muramidase (phage lysozyme)